MVSADAGVESVLTEIGFGRWQYFILFVALISYVVQPVQQLGSTLISAPVAFRCIQPEQISSDGFNTTLSFPSKCFHENQDIHQKEHQDVRLGIRTGLDSCSQIEYDDKEFHSTVVTEWHLVCENSFLRPLYQMMFSVGSFLSSTFCGQLSDWLGRKRTFQIGAVLTLIAVFITSIVPWYGVMLFMRIISGTGTILMVFPTYTLISEISPSNWRTITALCPGLVYFAALPVFAGIGYLIPNWRRLLLICNSPLLLLIPLTFMIDESPRWLLQRGRKDEAVSLLKKAAKKNGVLLPPSALSALETFIYTSEDAVNLKADQEAGETKSQGTLQLMRSCFTLPGMRRILIVSPILMFLNRALHIGVYLNANNFTSTNPFEYIAIMGGMSVISIILSMPVSQRLGRKIIIGGALSIGGGLLLIDLAVPAEFWWAKLIMVITSCSIVCAAFQVTFVYRAELFPTVIRTRGFTFTNFAGALGEMGIPLITEIAVLYQWWTASVTFGLIGIAGSLLLPLLPETKDKPMPETLQDVEDRYWNNLKATHSNDKRQTQTEDSEILQV